MYVCLRDPNLRMFQWFDFIGAGSLITRLRFATAPLQNTIPFWIQFSVPNALWVYSLTGFMALVWSETDSRTKPFWLSLGLLLGAGTEFGQALNIVPGSFDMIDLSLCVIATPLALLTTANLPFIKRRLNDVTT
jgi:hypothetical protein